MQVIITDPHSPKSYIFNFSWLFGCLAVGLLCAAGAVVYGFLTPNAQEEQLRAELISERYAQQLLQQNMAEMARKVGEMQAKLVSLEGLAAKVAELAEIPAAEVSQSIGEEAGGQGGILVAPRPLTHEELSGMLGQMDVSATAQSDFLLFAQAKLFDGYFERKRIPTQEPVPGRQVGSGFGRRVDPITGASASHTGLDFQAPVGTPIYAAAGGVVITSQFHPAYGNMLEVDHGNGLMTRYAHASALLAERGDVIKRGDLIAKVGSTGRSTGPHLHFEVLVQGIHQDPRKFLRAGAKTDVKAILASK